MEESKPKKRGRPKGCKKPSQMVRVPLPLVESFINIIKVYKASLKEKSQKDK